MINITHGSSYWKLITLWGSEQLPDNFCDLFWLTLWRLFMLSLGCLLAGAFLAYLGASIAASIVLGEMIWSSPIMMILGFGVIIGVIMLIGAKYKVVEMYPDGAISNFEKSYVAWKDKVCPQVRIKRKD